MLRFFACAALAALAGIVAHAGTVTPVSASRLSARYAATVTAGPVVAHHEPFRASLQRISAKSALWRDAVAKLEHTGRRVHVLTPDQVVFATSGQSSRERRAQSSGEQAFGSILAEAAPVPTSGSRVDEVLVVVNLHLIEQLHRQTGSLPIEMHLDLDRILVHEVYGHAVPYLLAGDLSGRCADPLPGQAAGDACAIRRENEVRAELGLGRRTDYGTSDLLLARRQWE
jgi:hypothetical protein